MGVQKLGPRKHKCCEEILGQAITSCHTTGVHHEARCWLDEHRYAVVNYRTRQVVRPVQYQAIGTVLNCFNEGSIFRLPGSAVRQDGQHEGKQDDE